MYVPQWIGGAFTDGGRAFTDRGRRVQEERLLSRRDQAVTIAWHRPAVVFVEDDAQHGTGHML